MDSCLNGNVAAFTFKDHVNILLLSWLFWINLTELQAQFVSEVTVNIESRYFPIKCTYVSNQLTGHCYCPKADSKFMNFLCQCHIGEKNITYENYICSCQHNATKTNPINCNCTSPENSLTVKCNKISNKNIIKVGVLVPFTAGDSALPSTYLLGIYYASAMFVARDDINQNKFLLTNHSLDLVWGNTECNKKKTVRLAMKMIEEQQVDAIIGVGCDSCLVTATIAGIYNIPLISHVRVMNLCCHCSQMLFLMFLVFFK